MEFSDISPLANYRDKEKEPRMNDISMLSVLNAFEKYEKKNTGFIRVKNGSKSPPTRQNDLENLVMRARSKNSRLDGNRSNFTSKHSETSNSPNKNFNSTRRGGKRQVGTNMTPTLPIPSKQISCKKFSEILKSRLSNLKRNIPEHSSSKQSLKASLNTIDNLRKSGSYILKTDRPSQTGHSFNIVNKPSKGRKRAQVMNSMISKLARSRVQLTQRDKGSTLLEQYFRESEKVGSP